MSTTSALAGVTGHCIDLIIILNGVFNSSKVLLFITSRFVHSRSRVDLESHKRSEEYTNQIAPWTDFPCELPAAVFRPTFIIARSSVIVRKLCT